MSSAENIPGPRNGDTVLANKKGGFVFTVLNAARVIDLTPWKGQYIKIKWKPAAAELLFFGFYDTVAAANAATLDGTTTQATEPTVTIAHAADWLSAELPLEHMQVPFDCPVLKIIPSTGSGRCTIRHAEQGAVGVTS